MTAWRIAVEAPTYTANDLSGEGARITGGRWNKKGIPLLYASSTRALACIETLVHLDLSLPMNRFLVEISIPLDEWNKREVFSTKDNAGWEATPPGRISIAWGTAWAKANKTLVAEVPSVAVPEEINVLLNPAHPEIKLVRARTVRLWQYDPRITMPTSRPPLTK